MAAAHAERLARAGIAVLTFDKQGVGASSGDWRRETFADYAADVAGGLERLKAHPRIDGTRIGLIGHSQGGWTAPLAAQRAGRIAFIVLLSATPLSPLEQSIYVEEGEMAHRSMPVSDQREALGAWIDSCRRIAAAVCSRASARRPARRLPP